MHKLQNRCDPFELVKTYQIHSHSIACWKHNKNECRFSNGPFSTDKTVTPKPLETGEDIDKKNKILIWRLLKKIESYNDNHLNPAKKNTVGPRKEIFLQPLSIPQK